jgi:hypothetical protein
MASAKRLFEEVCPTASSNGLLSTALQKASLKMVFQSLFKKPIERG